MVIGQFLNPEEKKIDNNIKIVVNKILKVYSIRNRNHKTRKTELILKLDIL